MPFGQLNPAQAEVGTRQPHSPALGRATPPRHARVRSVVQANIISNFALACTIWLRLLVRGALSWLPCQRSRFRRGRARGAPVVVCLEHGNHEAHGRRRSPTRYCTPSKPASKRILRLRPPFPRMPPHRDAPRTWDLPQHDQSCIPLAKPFKHARTTSEPCQLTASSTFCKNAFIALAIGGQNALTQGSGPAFFPPL